MGPCTLGFPEIMTFLYVDTYTPIGLHSCTQVQSLFPGSFQTLNSASSWEWGGVAEGLGRAFSS